MSVIVINRDKCRSHDPILKTITCRACYGVCREACINWRDNPKHERGGGVGWSPRDCRRCGNCVASCPYGAITLEADND